MSGGAARIHGDLATVDFQTHFWELILVRGGAAGKG